MRRYNDNSLREYMENICISSIVDYLLLSSDFFADNRNSNYIINSFAHMNYDNLFW